ncbi:penicillin acylase family protein [Bailinhaonella thermotolerans]|uniref:penicillin acylase family protein n=1 Tax=Bailinhaonella thermotolerans TaxID=1070861 RepID=UPI001F5BFF6F|nr:penicillin acylase family protein [Bailinhaonella thermotolerans]
MRWFARLLVLLLVLALLLAGVVVWSVRRAFPQLDGELKAPGLSANVSVYRDKYGVPHLYADTPEDLFFAQGFVHAQDRFWEMDFRRKTTAGRLSELFGKATLDTDKVIRTMGWRRVAEQELSILNPRTRAYLDRYAAGVNAWMKATPGKSLEYSVLKLTNRDYEPEPWTAVDSLAWLKAMAWDLRSNMEDELARAIAATAVPRQRAEELWPRYPYELNSPIVSEVNQARATSAALTPIPEESRDALARAARAVRAAPDLIGTDGDNSGIGSNSWVVSGAHTVSGKPLLANDPHLSPHMPSTWYQMGLHCRERSESCPFDLTGFTFAGLPSVVIGHNHRIAWGFTNLGPDVSDIYLERLRGQEYQYRDGWKPLETRTERIKVAGGETVTLTVRETGHGPLLSDVLGTAKRAIPGAAKALNEPDEEKEYGVALRWTALDPGRTADALFLMGTAENWDSFRAAAKSFEVPAQNLVYADVDGTIGYQAPGRIPVRSGGGDGAWPAAGWTGQVEWTGWVPYEKLPTQRDPVRGYIVTANNAATGPSTTPQLTRDWSYGYRSQRIIDRLKQAIQKGKVDAATMSSIQRDSRNAFAPELTRYLLNPDLKLAGPVKRAVKLFDGWDFGQSKDSAAAAYYNAVWRHLLIRTFNDELPEGARPDGGDQWYEVLRPLLAEPSDPWWDDVKTKGVQESRDQILLLALEDAFDELSDRLGPDPSRWAWGDLHSLTLTNDTFGTSGIAPIEWLFNRGPLRVDGGKDAVDAAGWNVQRGYDVTAVPSMRMVVDLADMDQSRWINLTGASGHAFHDNYWDQAGLWADGKTIPMRSRPESVRREAVNTLTLTP